VAQSAGVQRVIKELEAEGFVKFKPNPHHRRAHLVVLSRKGEAAHAAVERRQIPWAKGLAKGLRLDDVNRATELMASVRRRLEAEINGRSAAKPDQPRRATLTPPDPPLAARSR